MFPSPVVTPPNFMIEFNDTKPAMKMQVHETLAEYFLLKQPAHASKAITAKVKDLGRG